MAIWNDKSRFLINKRPDILFPNLESWKVQHFALERSDVVCFWGLIHGSMMPSHSFAIMLTKFHSQVVKQPGEIVSCFLSHVKSSSSERNAANKKHKDVHLVTPRSNTHNLKIMIPSKDTIDEPPVTSLSSPSSPYPPLVMTQVRANDKPHILCLTVNAPSNTLTSNSSSRLPTDLYSDHPSPVGRFSWSKHDRPYHRGYPWWKERLQAWPRTLPELMGDQGAHRLRSQRKVVWLC